MKIPTHLAIIMDGNGRWAQSRGHQRIYGHVRGAKVARQIIRSAGTLGIKFLTLYAFSTENWNRPSSEVDFLMRILHKYLVRERTTLMNDNVRFRSLGDISKLPLEVQRVISETIKLTENNTGLTLNFALNYGGRQEIVEAVKLIADRVAMGQLHTEEVNEELISSLLYSNFMPDPDLIIRTSGELRISNFLIWQSAYSEFYFTSVSWPEFNIQELEKALMEFGQRERRFGGVRSADEDVRSEPIGKGLLESLRNIKPFKKTALSNV